MGVLERQDRRVRCRSAGAGFRPSRHSRPAAYTLLELQVTLVILATGLLAMPVLLAMQGRQIRRVEAWCRPAPTYYLVSQSNRWLRRLGAPAEIQAEAGQSPWTPPVIGGQVYDVQLNSLTEDLDNRTIEADVALVAAGG